MGDASAEDVWDVSCTRGKTAGGQTGISARRGAKERNVYREVGSRTDE